MAKNHVKGIIIVGVTQTGKKSTSSTPFEFPKEDKLDGVVLLGFKNKFTHSLAQMVFLSQFPLKTGSVQVALTKSYQKLLERPPVPSLKSFQVNEAVKVS